MGPYEYDSSGGVERGYLTQGSLQHPLASIAAMTAVLTRDLLHMPKPNTTEEPRSLLALNAPQDPARHVWPLRARAAST
jgi:hypothetical protein